jgi:hypothetical protein
MEIQQNAPQNAKIKRGFMYIPLEIQQIWSMQKQANSCIADWQLARLDKLGRGI